MKRLWIFFISLSLCADTATVLPASDSATGGWTTAPLFSKVNDDIDTPDAVVITSGNNPATIVTFTVACPGGVGIITAANLRIRAGQNNVARNISLAVSWSATAGTNFDTSTLNKTALQNYASGEIGSLSINKATCDASTISFTPTTTGTGPAAVGTIDSFNLDITYTAGAQRRRNATVSLNRRTQ